jgi:uncharacterized protein
MTKYFLLLLIVLFAIWFARRSARPKPRADIKECTDSDEMVRCAYCEVFLPRGDAILVAGRAYCCDEHRQMGEDPRK